MKQLLLVLFSVLSFSASAITCQEVFNAGKENFDLGQEKFIQSKKEIKAIKNINNREDICSALKKSLILMSQANDFFEEAGEFFTIVNEQCHYSVEEEMNTLLNEMTKLKTMDEQVGDSQYVVCFQGVQSPK